MMNSSLCVRCEAYPHAARRLRHALAAFLEAIQMQQESSEDILIAAGEAVANAIEHAYAGNTPGFVTLAAKYHEPSILALEVTDTGVFIEREERVGRTFGLRIIQSVAQTVEMHKGNGTSISMTFQLQGF